MQLPQGQILIDKYLCALCPETGGGGIHAAQCGAACVLILSLRASTACAGPRVPLSRLCAAFILMHRAMFDSRFCLLNQVVFDSRLIGNETTISIR
jgi:hypothetical protein